jgi:hypothetical protein
MDFDKGNEIGLSTDRPPGHIFVGILAGSSKIFNAVSNVLASGR